MNDSPPVRQPFFVRHLPVLGYGVVLVGLCCLLADRSAGPLLDAVLGFALGVAVAGGFYFARVYQWRNLLARFRQQNKAMLEQSILLRAEMDGMREESVRVRGQAHDEQRKHEIRYRELAENVSDGYYALDREGRVVYWSRHCERIFGWKADEVAGKPFLLFFPHLIGTDLDQAHQRALTTLHAQQVQQEMTVSGDFLQMQVRVYPSHEGIGVMLQNVTPHLEATRRFHDLAEEVTDGFFMVGPDLRFLYMNPAVGELLHLTGGPALAGLMPLAQRHAWADEIVTQAHRVMQSGRKVTFVHELPHEDTPVFLEFIIYPNPRGLSFFVRDITERRHKEEQLVRSEQLYRMMAENFPGYIAIVDRQRHVHFLKVQPQGAEAAGTMGEMFAGRTAPLFDASYETAFSGRPERFEAFIGQRYYAFRVLPLFDAGTTVERLLVVAQDISEIKRLLDQTVELENLKLAREIEMHKIQSASLLAGQENEKQRFAKELHDGVGQTLNVLKLKTDTLKSAHPDLSQPMADLSQMIADTIAEVRGLINDMSPYSLQHLGLNSAVHHLLGHYNGVAGLESELVAWINLPNEDRVRPHELSIYRIVQESVHNAVKYACASQINVQLTEIGDTLLLMVEDDGVGFDYAARIGRGNGLHNIAERCRIMNAEHEIDTRPGGGCTISIRIPLIPVTTAP